jgi:hypothetical protein
MDQDKICTASDPCSCQIISGKMEAVTLFSPRGKKSAMCNIRIAKQPHGSLASNRGTDQKQVLPDKIQLQCAMIPR